MRHTVLSKGIVFPASKFGEGRVYYHLTTFFGAHNLPLQAVIIDLSSVHPLPQLYQACFDIIGSLPVKREKYIIAGKKCGDGAEIL